MSQTVRTEVSPQSQAWGYQLGSVYIRKVHFRDAGMIKQIEEKVVNRLRQVTSAIKQAGANQVSVITSSAEREASIEFAKAAAIRPSTLGQALREIAQAARRGRGAVRDSGDAKATGERRAVDAACGGPAQPRAGGFAGRHKRATSGAACVKAPTPSKSRLGNTWVRVRNLKLTKTSLDKGKIKILLLEGVHSSAVEAFRRDGYSDIEYHPKSLPEPKLLASIKDAYLVGIRSNTRLSSRILEQAERLLAIGCFCIGTNQVDLDAAQERGIPVFNAPFSNTRSVAELVLAEIIMLLRGIPYRNAMAHRGGWVKTAAGSYEVRGKCLGIVGYGHIGTQIGLLAEALGMQVVYYDVETKLALGNARAMPSLEALLEAADVVTLHVPETPQTRGMIGASRAGADEAGRAAHQCLARNGGGYRRAGRRATVPAPGGRRYGRVSARA